MRNHSGSVVGQIGFGGVTDRIPVLQFGCCDRRSRMLWQEHLQRWGSTDTEVEGPSEAEPLDCIGRSTADVRGATRKTLIIKDLLDFRVVIFITLKLVKPLSIRQLRDAPGVYGNKKPL